MVLKMVLNFTQYYLHPVNEPEVKVITLAIFAIDVLG